MANKPVRRMLLLPAKSVFRHSLVLLRLVKLYSSLVSPEAFGCYGGLRISDTIIPELILKLAQSYNSHCLCERVSAMATGQKRFPAPDDKVARSHICSTRLSASR